MSADQFATTEMPYKPFSGRLLLRLPAALHRAGGKIEQKDPIPRLSDGVFLFRFLSKVKIRPQFW